MSRLRTQRHTVAFDSPAAIVISLLVWAILSWLSYPAANFWPLAHLALVPLTLLALRCSSLKQLSIYTYIAGILWWLVAVAWLRDVTGPGYVAVTFYLGLYPLLFVWLVRLLARRTHLPMVLTVPLVVVTLEYFRGWLMTGFPWFLHGQSQPVTLIQIADLAGVYGVSFLVGMTNGLIVDLVTNPLVGRRRGVRGIRGRGGMGRTVKFSLWLWGAAMVLTIIYGRWRIHQYDHMPAATPTMRIAVVQTDVPQSNKNQPTDQQEQADFDKLLQLTTDATVANPQLIVWPETVVQRPINAEMVAIARAYCQRLTQPVESDAQRRSLQYWCAAYAYARQVTRAAVNSGAYLIAGADAYTDWQGSSPTHRYNSAYCYSPTGQLIDRYDKVHRVPYGEYIPFSPDSWLHKLLLKLSPYDFDFGLSPGSRYTVFHLQVPTKSGESQLWRVAAPICFEDIFPRECRRMVYDRGGKRADVLVNLTNDGWYPGSAEAIQHEQLARFRCIENRVPMARAVNRGVSGVYDSVGRRITAVYVQGQRQLVSGVTTALVKHDDRSTLFGRIGNTFAILCGITVIVLAAFCILAPRPRK